MNNRTIVFSLGVIFLFSLLGATSASAQYFENARPSYLPTKSNQKDLTLSRAGSESGFHTQGPPPLRFGAALDFGVGSLGHTKSNVNNVVALAWDVTLYLQLHDTVRVGVNVGQQTGTKDYQKLSLLRGGLNLEVGQRFYTGWGFWVGADIGYGRGAAESTLAGMPSGAGYIAKGVGFRVFIRGEIEVAPFITLRLTPFVDTMVRTSDNLGGGGISSGTSGRGTFLGYGAMVGIAFHSF